MNISNILEGWKNSLNQQSLTNEERVIATHRLEGCTLCSERRVVIGWAFCNKCGCKLPQKAFSFSDTNNCPLNKW